MKRPVIVALILLAGISAAAAAREVSPPADDPLGLSTSHTPTPDVIDSTPTSAIDSPEGMTTPTVPNDMLGTPTEPPLPPIPTPPDTAVPLAPMPAN